MKITNIGPLLILISSTFHLSACSTLSDSLILGIGSGAATGAIVGGQIRDSGGDRAGAGAAIGAAVGGLSAYLIHKSFEKREEKIRRETLLNLEKYDVSSPPKNKSEPVPIGQGHALTKPVVDMEWVETRVDGDKLVEGHRVWRIIEKSKWLPDDAAEKERSKK